jgi:hypothetical protein
MFTPTGRENHIKIRNELNLTEILPTSPYKSSKGNPYHRPAIKPIDYKKVSAASDFILYSQPNMHSSAVCQVYKGSTILANLESETHWTQVKTG